MGDYSWLRIAWLIHTCHSRSPGPSCCSFQTIHTCHTVHGVGMLQCYENKKKRFMVWLKKITHTNYPKAQELLWLFSRFAKRITCVLIGAGCSFDRPLAAPFLPFAVFSLAFDPLCGLIRIRHLITFKPYEQPWEQASKFLHSNTVPAYVYILHHM